MRSLPSCSFNPRPREGANRHERGFDHCVINVSIRAPVRGRTRRLIRCGQRRTRFNPRPREGANALRCAAALSRATVSIRAPVRGRTRRGQCPGVGQNCFNPRPREGANPCRAGLSRRIACFNPRPREGANPYQDCAFNKLCNVSIRAPVRGRTPGRVSLGLALQVFQSAPP